MNTSSYSPITSSTYNRWKVEFVLKTNMTKTSIQRRLWRNFIQRGLVAPIFIHSRSLLERNASLKCVCSGSSHIMTVSRCYRKLNAHFMVLPDRSIMHKTLDTIPNQSHYTDTGSTCPSSTPYIPPLPSVFRRDFKPRSRLNDLVVSGTLN